MANTIKIKRGSNANLPSLNEGELAFTTDTKQLYAGTASGNKELFKDIPFPTGGLTGELLVKKSDADYDAEWQDLLGKVVYKYKRRIMVGDDLDNRTIYFTFPDDYVPTTTGTMGHAIISGQYSSIWEQPYSNDPMDTEILISGLGLLRTIYKPKDSSAKLTSTNIGVEEIGEVTAIDDSNPSYRHCYIEDPNIRPIQIGDILGQNTRLYFVFPDNFITWDSLSQYIDTTTQSSITIVGSATGIYDMGLDVTSNPETLSTRANPGVYSVIRFYVEDDNEVNPIAYTPQTIGTEATYKNKSTYLYTNTPTTSQDSNKITSINPNFNQYILVDERTLVNNARKLDMTLDNLL